MRATWMIGALLATVAGGQAENRTVSIYLIDVGVLPFVNLAIAQGVAARIFAEAGITIRWKTAMPPGADAAAIVVRFEGCVPAAYHPGALGYAYPFARSATVYILYGRVAEAGPGPLTPFLLGHVLAHEIGHVLRRDDGHERGGVMKARWTASDIRDMSRRSFAFSAVDAAMMHQHLAGPRTAALRSVRRSSPRL